MLEISIIILWSQKVKMIHRLVLQTIDEIRGVYDFIIIFDLYHLNMLFFLLNEEIRIEISAIIPASQVMQGYHQEQFPKN